MNKNEASAVFLSYRHPIHVDAAALVAQCLEVEQIRVIYDQEELREILGEGVAGSAPISGGLEFFLLMAIQQCAVAVVFHGDSSPEVPERFGNFAKEVGDRLLAEIVVAGALGQPQTAGLMGSRAAALWYQKFYGINISKHIDESWRDWETRIAKQMGLTIIPVVVVGPERWSDLFLPNPHLLEQDNLLEEFRRKIIPLIRAAPRNRLKPLPLPEYRAAFGAAELTFKTIKVSADAYCRVKIWVKRTSEP